MISLSHLHLSLRRLLFYYRVINSDKVRDFNSEIFWKVILLGCYNYAIVNERLNLVSDIYDCTYISYKKTISKRKTLDWNQSRVFVA